MNLLALERARALLREQPIPADNVESAARVLVAVAERRGRPSSHPELARAADRGVSTVQRVLRQLLSLELVQVVKSEVGYASTFDLGRRAGSVMVTEDPPSVGTSVPPLVNERDGRTTLLLERAKEPHAALSTSAASPSGDARARMREATEGGRSPATDPPGGGEGARGVRFVIEGANLAEVVAAMVALVRAHAGAVGPLAPETSAPAPSAPAVAAAGSPPPAAAPSSWPAPIAQRKRRVRSEKNEWEGEAGDELQVYEGVSRILHAYPLRDRANRPARTVKRYKFPIVSAAYSSTLLFRARGGRFKKNAAAYFWDRLEYEDVDLEDGSELPLAEVLALVAAAEGARSSAVEQRHAERAKADEEKRRRARLAQLRVQLGGEQLERLVREAQDRARAEGGPAYVVRARTEQLLDELLERQQLAPTA